MVREWLSNTTANKDLIHFGTENCLETSLVLIYNYRIIVIEWLLDNDSHKIKNRKKVVNSVITLLLKLI